MNDEVIVLWAELCPLPPSNIYIYIFLYIEVPTCSTLAC